VRHADDADLRQFTLESGWSIIEGARAERVVAQFAFA
jgi:hypothetical protein